MTAHGPMVVLERSYPGVSPQLLARVRQNWSAQRLDLDLVWREGVAVMAGFCAVERGAAEDSRAVDLLLLFDQAFLWADALRRETEALDATAAERLTPEQVTGVAAVAGRLCDELAAVRMLSVAGLATPAMQVSRSVSEDVDLLLALLVRRKVASAFAACRTPEDAAEFWRRHIAGGRAFRLVARALYERGLDRAEDSEYGRWRREVLAFLGAAVHGSAVGRVAPQGARLGPMLQECLYFATVRAQELAAYALVLGEDLRAELARGVDAPSHRLRFLLRGGDILIDQMRWLTDAEAPAPGALH